MEKDIPKKKNGAQKQTEVATLMSEKQTSKQN
jgi:hypothetical protein